MKIATNIFIVLTAFLSVNILFARPVVATETYQGSAILKTRSISESDERVRVLKDYLDSHNSPIADYADDFVYYADKYELDWRLVASISGVESTFGKRIPYGSYNAYGWAGGKYYFESWENSIEIVSKTLREKYVDDGLVTVAQIAKRYAPPSDSWAWKVEFFMNDIEKYPFEFTI